VQVKTSAAMGNMAKLKTVNKKIINIAR